MDPVFKKLNLKQQRCLLIMNAPESFQSTISTLDDRQIIYEIQRSVQPDFVLCFVRSQNELNTMVSKVLPYISAADHTAHHHAGQQEVGEVVLWFAYPKKSSKKYSSDINRDQGWQLLGDAGYEGVRQVAIDADWSALRFRQAAFIAQMKRSPKRAMSAAGRSRVAKN